MAKAKIHHSQNIESHEKAKQEMAVIGCLMAGLVIIAPDLAGENGVDR